MGCASLGGLHTSPCVGEAGGSCGGIPLDTIAPFISDPPAEASPLAYGSLLHGGKVASKRNL